MKRFNAVPRRELPSGEDWMLDVDEARHLYGGPAPLQHELLAQVVEGLREPYRSVVEMRFWGRMSYEQIAQQMGWKDRTWTNTYLRRARKMIKKELLRLGQLG